MKALFRGKKEDELYSLKASAFGSWRIETMLSQIMGHDHKIEYKDYLSAFGLLTEEEQSAMTEYRRIESIRLKQESERRTADIMSWVYSPDYEEEV